MILTAPDLALLKERPHRTDLFLSIYKPTTIMACRVMDVGITRGEREIYYTGTTIGSWTDIVDDDLTMLVGTTIGSSDVGKVRILDVDINNFVVAENSDISWKDGHYLTVLNYVDIWNKYPRIVKDPLDDENVIFYKDYDIGYTNQNVVLGSFPCAGPHRAAFLESGIVDLYWSATGTSNVRGDTLTYWWDFEGSLSHVTGSSAETPGYVTYDTPGHYKTTLSVTSSSGGVDVTHRYVSIYDREGIGNNKPIVKWNMSSLDGNRAAGGYIAQIKVWEHLDDIQDNAIVVIFTDDWYGNTNKSLGGNAKNCSNIFFVGYITKGTIQYNYKESSVEFSIGSATEFMRQMEGFAVSCESKKTAKVNTWFEIDDMTVPKALYHYLKWHSTVLKVLDFQYTGQTSRHQYFDTDRASLFDSIDNFLRTALYGELISDRQGKLWAEVDVSATHDAITAVPTTMILNNQDWMAEPVIEEKQINELSYLEAGGISYTGPTVGTFSPFLSGAPGSAPSYRGKVERTQGLILTSQAQLNDITGDVFAYKNGKYNVSMKMSGNYRNIDIAPKEQCKLNINIDDTIRGITFTNKSFHPISMSWTWNSEKGFLSPAILFNEVTNGIGGETEQIPAETVDIPYVPPDFGFTIPDFVLPEFPAFSFPYIPSIKTYTWVISSPAIGGVPGPFLVSNATVLRFDAYCVGGTSVSFNIEDRLTIGVAGTNIRSVDLTAYTFGGSAVSFIHPLIPQFHWFWLDISNVDGAVTDFVVTMAVSI